MGTFVGFAAFILNVLHTRGWGMGRVNSLEVLGVLCDKLISRPEKYSLNVLAVT